MLNKQIKKIKFLVQVIFNRQFYEVQHEMSSYSIFLKNFFEYVKFLFKATGKIRVFMFLQIQYRGKQNQLEFNYIV